MLIEPPGPRLSRDGGSPHCRPTWSGRSTCWCPIRRTCRWGSTRTSNLLSESGNRKKPWWPNRAATDRGAGMADVETIIAGAPRWMSGDGTLVVELAPHQADAAAAMAPARGLCRRASGTRPGRSPACPGGHGTMTGHRPGGRRCCRRAGRRCVGSRGGRWCPHRHHLRLGGRSLPADAVKRVFALKAPSGRR